MKMKLLRVVKKDAPDDKEQNMKKYEDAVRALQRRYSKNVNLNGCSVEVILNLKERGDKLATFRIVSSGKFTAATAPDIRDRAKELLEEITNRVVEIEKQTGRKVESLAN